MTSAAGLLYIGRFCGRGACLAVRRAMDAGVPERAEVLGDGSQAIATRRASYVDVDQNTLDFIEARMTRETDRVAAFFGVSGREREGASVVRYAQGGRYDRHRDRAIAAGWDGAARRLITMVAFLNSSTGADRSGDFDGGVLRLYPEGHVPVEVFPREGQLVAFAASMDHEVTPVTRGIRDAVVDWLYSDVSG